MINNNNYLHIYVQWSSFECTFCLIIINQNVKIRTMYTEYTHRLLQKVQRRKKKCSILTQSITVLNKQHSDNILTVSKSRHCY